MGFSRLNKRRWKTRLIGRIGKMLSFQAKRRVFCKIVAGAVGHAAIQRISRIKLNTRFGGKYFELPPAFFLNKGCGMGEFLSAGFFVQNKIMVVATFDRVNILPDFFLFG